MERRNIITTPQLFSILFLSRIIVGFTYNLGCAESTEMWDHVVSAGIALVISLIICIPTYYIYVKNPNMDILDHSLKLFGKFGIVFVALYAIYYIFASCYTLSLFNKFVSNVMNPNISTVLLSLAVVTVTAYAACKGIEGLARTCAIILFIIMIAIIFIVFTLISQIDVMNYSPLLFDGTKDALNGVIYMISRDFYIPLMIMLLPFVNGNVKRTIIGINCTIFVFIIFIITLVVGVLGDYLKTQVFPLYAAASVAEIGVFRRLDAFYLGIFTTGLFIEIAVFLFAFSLIVTKMFSKYVGRVSVIIGAALILILSLLMPHFKALVLIFYNMYIVFSFTIVVAFIIPCIVLFRIQSQKKKERKQKYEA